MSRRKKIAIIAGAAVAVLAIVGFTVRQSRRNVVEVQAGKVERRDLASVVTASGEIKPQRYVNISANAFGKIVKLYVREGDRVRQGQLLAQLENVQSSADVAAMRSSLEAARTDEVAAEAALRTAQADLSRARAELERTKLDYERAQGLYQAALISKAEYDSRKAAYEAADAGLAQAQARVAQARAQRESARGRVGQAAATLTRASDVLSKTIYTAPFDGVVTNLPVREGETVVVGIQNSPGSTLMTISDLSVITAEVKVDETDIVNVKLGQPADVTIDAIPGKTFKGKVTEIGNIAVVRSTGLATSQTTTSSQEAKDFKVVVTLDDPPANLRPGLSSTAKITTATRQGVLTIPIQALTIRQKSDLEEKKGEKGAAQAAAPVPADKKKEELQGVFVIRDRKAVFVPVETGITGVTEIEVTSGLQEGDEIVTGSYRVLRSLRNGAGVKVEKPSERKKEEEES
ncbi:MAG TPA: efflux RND transporter periplasmic adaptor subunit [Terriglobales bacterium]|nr:efflux RND transporter periplasmic adaptor subunit [Terriglobales bacterium]